MASHRRDLATSGTTLTTGRATVLDTTNNVENYMTSESTHTGAPNPVPAPGRRFSTAALVGAGLVGLILGAIAAFAVTGLVFTVRVQLPPPPYPPPFSSTPPPGPLSPPANVAPTSTPGGLPTPPLPPGPHALPPLEPAPPQS
jgi:hypothetical protein